MVRGISLIRRWFAKPTTWVVLSTIFSVATNLLWLAQDSLQPYGDPAVHLDASYRMYRVLYHGDLLSFADVWLSSFRGGSDPPLFALLPLPFYVLLGFSTVVALLFLTSLIAVFNFFFFRLVTAIANSRVAALAVFIAGTLPVVYGMSRMFFVDYATMTVVTAYLYLLIKSQNFSRSRVNFWLGVTAGIGLLTKVIFPLYVFLPTLLIFLRRLSHQPKQLARDLTMAVTPAVLVASLWYAKNIIPAWSSALGRSFGSSSEIFSLGPIFNPQAIVQYWQRVVVFGLSPWYTFIFGTIAALWVLRAISRRSWTCVSSDAYVLAFGWFLFPLAVFTFSENREIRFITSALPGFALLLAVLWHKTFASFTSRFLPLLVVIPLAAYLLTSFNLVPPASLPGMLQPLLVNRIWYITPPRIAHFPLEEIVAFFTVQPQSLPTQPHLVLDLVQGEPLNWAALNYYATLRNVHQEVIFFGRGKIKPEDELALFGAVDYVLTVTPGYPYYGNLLAMRQQFSSGVTSGRLPFQQVTRFTLPDGAEAIVYRRAGFGGT